MDADKRHVPYAQKPKLLLKNEQSFSVLSDFLTQIFSDDVTCSCKPNKHFLPLSCFLPTYLITASELPEQTETGAEV